jgi:hypothetical protein
MGQRFQVEMPLGGGSFCSSVFVNLGIIDFRVLSPVKITIIHTGIITFTVLIHNNIPLLNILPLHAANITGVSNLLIYCPKCYVFIPPQGCGF